MNLQEEPAEPKLSEFMVTVNLPIPLRKITALKPQIVPVTDFT